MAVVLALVSVFFGGGAVDTGWTFYVPFSLKTTVNVPLAVFAVFILGMSSILTGINIVTTVHQLRAPGMRSSTSTGIVDGALIYILAMSVLLLFLIVFFNIFFAVRYRASRNPVPGELPESPFIEAIWVIVPTLSVTAILILAPLPLTGSLEYSWRTFLSMIGR